MSAHDNSSEWLVAGAALIIVLMLLSGGGKDKDRSIDPGQRSGGWAQAQLPERNRAAGGSSTAGPRHTWTEVALMKRETENTLDQVDRLLR